MRIRMTPPAPPPRQGQAKCSPFSFPPSFSTSTAGYCHVKPLPEDQNRPSRSTSLSGSDFRVRDETSTTESSTEVDSFSGLIRSSSGAFFPADMKYSSGNISSVGASDSDAITAPAERRNFPAGNDLDVYDCESEEGLWKATPRRSSSKRSRAAEVHNLSEKRRRSRINEKMKALQNLIPNSNKTDKASMLDEAIEYLKQLQLQVQMLSMRNGLVLHPTYLPGVLQPTQLPRMQMGFGEENGLLHMDMGAGTLTVNQETSARTVLCNPSHQSTMTNITNLETSFGLESSIQAHLGPSFQLSKSSEVGQL